MVAPVSAYRFSAPERYAVFTAHRERCWLCNERVSLSDFQVDHIIPESLGGKPELKAILVGYGVPETFNINSYENWAPAHPACNLKKTNLVLRPSPIIQAQVQLAERRAAKARDLAEKYASDRRIDSAIQELIFAHETGRLSGKQQQRVVGVLAALHRENREAEDKAEPLNFAPWLTIVGETEHYYHLQGPGGMVGSRPKAEKLDPSWDCPRCGPTGWNGARCITCGMMDDD